MCGSLPPQTSFSRRLLCGGAGARTPEGVQRGSRGGPEGVQRGFRGGPEGVRRGYLEHPVVAVVRVGHALLVGRGLLRLVHGVPERLAVAPRGRLVPDHQALLPPAIGSRPASSAVKVRKFRLRDFDRGFGPCPRRSSVYHMLSSLPPFFIFPAELAGREPIAVGRRAIYLEREPTADLSGRARGAGGEENISHSRTRTTQT
eukprot:1127253-Prorocentrum_minimum.AAC.9